MFPQFGTSDVSQLFATPANMSELVLVLALIVQLRIPVVLVTFSTAITLGVFSTAGAEFDAVWAPVLLVLTLLLADPATSPRTAVGRVIFGVSAGLLMIAGSAVMGLNGGPDFFAKILPLPFLNLLVPWFDAVGRRWVEQWPAQTRWFEPRFNRVHVALWFLFASLGITQVKGRMDHERAEFLRRNGASILIVEHDGSVDCGRNPAFCRPYSLLAEGGAWLRYLRTSSQ
jgi:hypothetical protein